MEPKGELRIHKDRVFLAEAMRSPIDNGLNHGGLHLSAIPVKLSHNYKCAQLKVTDDGKGFAPEQTDEASADNPKSDRQKGAVLGWP